jgi:hypothetical protein
MTEVLVVGKPPTVEEELLSILQPGVKFDYIAIDPASEDADTAVVVREGQVAPLEPTFEEKLAATMGAFTKGARDLVESGELRKLPKPPKHMSWGGPLTPKMRKARAASVAQRKARKAHNRARRNGKGKA